MKDETRPLRGHSDTQLEALVVRLERALFAGVSSHRDVVLLVEAEHELGLRERKRVRSTVDEERRARTLSGEAGWLSVPKPPSVPPAHREGTRG